MQHSMQPESTAQQEAKEKARRAEEKARRTQEETHRVQEAIVRERRAREELEQRINHLERALEEEKEKGKK